MIGNDGDALRPVRMMRAVGIVTGVVIVLALTYNIFFETGTWFNRKFIELAPKSVRTLYFDSVFLNADELCAGCRFRVINALDMIERDLNNSANHTNMITRRYFRLSAVTAMAGLKSRSATPHAPSY